METIIISLTLEQIRRSKYCEKYWDKIEYLIEHGAFELNCGKVIINYDKGGNITCVERRLYDYPESIDKQVSSL